jgi:hypothetical protein
MDDETGANVPIIDDAIERFLSGDEKKRLAALRELQRADLANGKELVELDRLLKRAIYAKHGIDWSPATNANLKGQKR